MNKEDAVEIVKELARKRMANRGQESARFDRYMRALEVEISGETKEERLKRLADLHWELFDEPPPFNPKAERPGHQPELPLGEEE